MGGCVLEEPRRNRLGRVLYTVPKDDLDPIRPPIQILMQELLKEFPPRSGAQDLRRADFHVPDWTSDADSLPRDPSPSAATANLTMSQYSVGPNCWKRFVSGGFPTTQKSVVQRSKRTPQVQFLLGPLMPMRQTLRIGHTSHLMKAGPNPVLQIEIVHPTNPLRETGISGASHQALRTPQAITGLPRSWKQNFGAERARRAASIFWRAVWFV